MSTQEFAPYPVVAFLLKNFLLGLSPSTRVKEFSINRVLVANVFEYELVTYMSVISAKEMLYKLGKMSNNFMLSSKTLIANLSTAPVKCGECKITAISAENIQQVFDILERVRQPTYLTNLDKILKVNKQMRKHLDIIEDPMSDEKSIGKAAETIKCSADAIINIVSANLPTVVLPVRRPITAESCSRSAYPFSGINLVYSVAELRDAVRAEEVKRAIETPQGELVEKNDFYVLGERPDEFGAVLYINPPANVIPTKAVKNRFKTKDVTSRPMSFRIFSDKGVLLFDKYVMERDIKTVFKYLFKQTKSNQE